MWFKGGGADGDVPEFSFGEVTHHANFCRSRCDAHSVGGECAYLNNRIVIGERPDPKPDQITVGGGGECTVSAADTNRQESPDRFVNVFQFAHGQIHRRKKYSNTS